MQRAIVLLSGGQDSTTSLFWALAHDFDCLALIIDYGQRHSIEIQSAQRIAFKAGIESVIVRTNILANIGNSALLEKIANLNCPHEKNKDLPSSFVPGRNIFFLTIAAMYGHASDRPNIITGVCETDSSDYPDCRSSFINSLEKTLALGMEIPLLRIVTPLMYKTKADTVRLANALPGCMEALALSHTCYEGKRPPCGECPSCKLRAKGFAEAGIPDPILNL